MTRKDEKYLIRIIEAIQEGIKRLIELNKALHRANSLIESLESLELPTDSAISISQDLTQRVKLSEQEQINKGGF